MTTKHTPGPWYVFHSAHLAWRDDNGPGAFSIGDAQTAYSANILCSRYQWPERAEEMKANASLIAAAPDLLEALQTLLGDTDDSDYMTRAEKEEKARAAIARATGESE